MLSYHKKKDHYSLNFQFSKNLGEDKELIYLNQSISQLIDQIYTVTVLCKNYDYPLIKKSGAMNDSFPLTNFTQLIIMRIINVDCVYILCDQSSFYATSKSSLIDFSK